MARRSGAVSSPPYDQCRVDRNKSEDSDKGRMMTGLMPRTEACYKALEDFTTLANHQVDVRFASVPPRVEKALNRLGRLVRLPLLPYWTDQELDAVVHSPPPYNSSGGKVVGLVHLDVSFLPDEDDALHQVVNVAWMVNSTMERYDGIALPFHLPLPSASLSFANRVAHHINGQMP